MGKMIGDENVKQVNHEVDLCIIGGGMAGFSAAIAAARSGIKVALIHDRPVLGGNASSEIRMWICGAHGENNRETGILEEIMMENLYRNPTTNYSIWDSILYEKVRFEENITLLLNCTCTEVKIEGNKISLVKGWQLTSETWHIVEAEFFADCSGDSILAPLTGAEFCIGRESRAEFNEAIEPIEKDDKTMGMSCLLQIRETDRVQPFIPPTWANKYLTDEDLPNREHPISTNFWWIELGGEQDSIHDTEGLRDELLKITFGVWDHMKNHGDHGVGKWVLDWVGFLPGKRESRRYIGDYILTQNDIEAEGKFRDIIGYGGWTMDDHHPAGMKYEGYPTIFHPAPSPFGIPYRCLYSKNISNLFFAGRNISVTHAAMSATRVMATCAVLGQAVGVAAAIAVNEKITPRGVYHSKIEELQQRLMEEDCYLPWHIREIPALSRDAKLSASEGNVESLRNGIDRPVNGIDNGWRGNIGAWIAYQFDAPTEVHEIRLVFDSDLNRPIHNMPCNYPLEQKDFHVPASMVKGFRIEAEDEDGKWQLVKRVENNYQRLVRINLCFKTNGVRLVPESTWGEEQVHIFAFDIR